MSKSGFITKIEKLFDQENYAALFKAIIAYYPNQNNKITVMCEIEDYVFMMKVYAPGAIVCNTDRKDGESSPFVESEVLRILNKEFFDLTPCIPLLIYTHKMSEGQVKKHIKSIQECLKDSKDPCHQMCLIWDNLNSGLSTGEPTFILMEAGHINFHGFCKNAGTHLDFWIIKSVVWMTIYTLQLIRAKYPKFKHGDLYTRNIVLHVDSEYLQEEHLASSNYIKFGTSYYVPYVGLIPKIIDYELTYLDDNLKALYKMQLESDDLLQLLYDIKSIYTVQNQITEFVNNLIGINIGIGKTYVQVSDIVHRNGGLPNLQKMLDSPLFGYKKNQNIEKEQIWAEY